jgi:hypothetical protein
MKILTVAFCLSLSFFLSACLFQERYAAEVVYREGNENKVRIWGDFPSLAECQGAAIDVYNVYFRERRAISWACLKKNNSGGYTSRHR